MCLIWLKEELNFVDDDRWALAKMDGKQLILLQSKEAVASKYASLQPALQTSLSAQVGLLLTKWEAPAIVKTCVICLDEFVDPDCGIFYQGSSGGSSTGDSNEQHFMCNGCLSDHLQNACENGGAFEEHEGSPARSIPCCLFPQKCDDGALPEGLVLGKVSDEARARFKNAIGRLAVDESRREESERERIEEEHATRQRDAEQKAQLCVSEALTMGQSVPCPGCRNPKRKDDACMHMSCDCGVHFCYACGADRYPGVRGTGPAYRARRKVNCGCDTTSIYLQDQPGWSDWASSDRNESPAQGALYDTTSDNEETEADHEGWEEGEEEEEREDIEAGLVEDGSAAPRHLLSSASGVNFTSMTDSQIEEHVLKYLLSHPKDLLIPVDNSKKDVQAGLTRVRDGLSIQIPQLENDLHDAKNRLENGRKALEANKTTWQEEKEKFDAQKAALPSVARQQKEKEFNDNWERLEKEEENLDAQAEKLKSEESKLQNEKSYLKQKETELIQTKNDLEDLRKTVSGVKRRTALATKWFGMMKMQSIRLSLSSTSHFIFNIINNY